MTLRTAPWFVADFDSASAMVQASARFLHGEDFPGLGLSRRLEPLAIAVNYLPRPLRRFIYTYSGGAEAIAPARISEIRAEEVSRWATGLYPERAYPAIAIGSSNGALVHLCAALGIPPYARSQPGSADGATPRLLPRQAASPRPDLRAVYCGSAAYGRHHYVARAGRQRSGGATPMLLMPCANSATRISS
jgi:hypothetical protein